MNSITNNENTAPIVFEIRNTQVMVDYDLAMMYDVALEDLHLATQTYANRFPEHFMFKLNKDENQVICEQHPRFKTNAFCSITDTLVFTQLGMYMLSSVLDTPKAVDININILETIHVQRTPVSEAKVKEALQVLDAKINNAVNFLNKKIETIGNETPSTERKPVGYTYEKKDTKLK
ncbi:MAG: ORF6N domain-containing protein [Bacteroidia bacterium]